MARKPGSAPVAVWRFLKVAAAVVACLSIMPLFICGLMFFNEWLTRETTIEVRVPGFGEHTGRDHCPYVAGGGVVPLQVVVVETSAAMLESGYINETTSAKTRSERQGKVKVEIEPLEGWQFDPANWETDGKTDGVMAVRITPPGYPRTPGGGVVMSSKRQEIKVKATPEGSDAPLSDSFWVEYTAYERPQ